MHATFVRLYREVLANPYDFVAKMVLADYLEENGRDKLAIAFRWAARHGRKPQRGTVWNAFGRRMGWYWEAEGPSSTRRTTAQLPIWLYARLPAPSLRMQTQSCAYRRLAVALDGAKERTFPVRTVLNRTKVHSERYTLVCGPHSWLGMEEGSPESCYHVSYGKPDRAGLYRTSLSLTDFLEYNTNPRTLSARIRLLEVLRERGFTAWVDRILPTLDLQEVIAY